MGGGIGPNFWIVGKLWEGFAWCGKCRGTFDFRDIWARILSQRVPKVPNCVPKMVPKVELLYQMATKWSPEGWDLSKKKCTRR